MEEAVYRFTDNDGDQLEVWPAVMEVSISFDVNYAGVVWVPPEEVRRLIRKLEEWLPPDDPEPVPARPVHPAPVVPLGARRSDYVRVNEAA